MDKTDKTIIDPEAADTWWAADRKMRPRGWTITRRLWAGFGFLILVLVFAVGSSYWQLGNIETTLNRMIEVDLPLEHAILEMEINAGETARAVLDYENDPGPAHLEKILNSEANFERFTAIFDRLAVNPEEKGLGLKVAVLYGKFKALGDDIVGLVDQRHQARSRFAKDIETIDGLINSDLQAALDKSGPRAARKRELSLGMEVYIFEAFTAIEGYITHSEPALLDRIVNAEKNFQRLSGLYRETRLSGKEREVLALIAKGFADAVTAGNRVIAIVNDLNKRQGNFKEALEIIDDILDNRIQPLVRGLAVRAAEGAKRSTGQAVLVLVVLSVIGVGVGLLAAWGITRNIGVGLGQLVMGAEIIGGGDTDHQMDTGRQDEFGFLAAAFNRMMANLNQVQDEALKDRGRLQSILDTAADSIITIKPDGTVLSFNATAEKLFGYDAGEVMGRNIKMLMPSPYRGNHDGFLSNYLAGGDKKIIGIGREVEGRRQNGTTFPMHLAVSETQVGDEVTFTGIVRDISENKLAERNLIAAKDEAETANRAKSEFLSSMSHELRTPLNAILGFAQLLEINQKNTLDESGKESVKQILSGGDHLLRLIDDVLNLAQIESGQLSLLMEPTDPADIFEECLAFIRTLAEKRGIKVIDRTMDMDLPIIIIDTTRLKQVLLNLLSNAVKYNHDDGSVFLIAEKTVEGKFRVSVSDTGPGIPIDKQDQLFQPFSRLGLEASDIQGTGIGLTVTKQLVEMMDGSIGFDSAPGRGTTFWVEFPVEANAEVKKTAKRPLKPTDFIKSEGHTMLYVEDNPANLKLMETLIDGMKGITMVSAHTGELDLELAEAHKPDVIILDINLPGINGFQALHRLKESEATRDIPVIALTANAMPSEVERGLEAGFHRYLTKPIRIHEVTATLESALEVA